MEVGGVRSTLTRVTRGSRNQRATIAPPDLSDEKTWERKLQERRKNKPTCVITNTYNKRV